MATHKSAEKRARQDLRKNAVNRKTRSEVRTLEKKVRDLVAKKDAKAAEALLREFMSVAQKAAKKNVMHFKNTARRISRLSKAVSQGK